VRDKKNIFNLEDIEMVQVPELFTQFISSFSGCMGGNPNWARETPAHPRLLMYKQHSEGILKVG